MYPTNDNHLQCAHSPIAMTTTHFVVWHNDPLPLTNNSISSAKNLQITLELLSLVCGHCCIDPPSISKAIRFQAMLRHPFSNLMHSPIVKIKLLRFEWPMNISLPPKAPRACTMHMQTIWVLQIHRNIMHGHPHVEYLHCNNEYFVELTLKPRRFPSACPGSTQPTPIEPPTLPL